MRIERRDLLKAVLATRDELDPGLDTGLLEAILDAESGAGDDGDAAMRAIKVVVDAAVRAGVGAGSEQVAELPSTSGSSSERKGAED